MKWELEVDYEKGIMTISQGAVCVAWQHTDGDTPQNDQAVLAMENLVKLHNELIDGVQNTLESMIPADKMTILRGMEYLGYLTSSEKISTINAEEEEW